MSEDYSELTELAQQIFDGLVNRFNFLGGLIIGLGSNITEFECVLASGIPLSPFKGTDEITVKEILRDCIEKNSEPHVHSTKGFAICSAAAKHGKWEHETKRIWFQPFDNLKRSLVYLGFIPKGEFQVQASEVLPILEKISTLLIYERELNHARRTLKETENFVREIGHDFAGNVQAILSKVYNLKRGNLSYEQSKKKLNEIETEIISAHTQAEQLGITIDSSYEMRGETSFVLSALVDSALLQLEAEAKERKITFTVPKINSSTQLNVWGDSGAIAICIFQLMLNAIKYAFEGSAIEIKYSGDSEFVHLSIQNIGHPLPEGADEKKIWDLGFRGEIAKSMHVNGSGVGLYTVNKITKAHYGTCTSYHSKSITIFTLKLPRRNIMKNKVGWIPL